MRLRRSALRWSAGGQARHLLPVADHEPLTPLPRRTSHRGACDDVFARGGDNTGKRRGRGGSWVSEERRGRGGGGGGGGPRRAVGWEGARAGRARWRADAFAPRRARPAARVGWITPAPKPQNPETPKRRRRGPRARNATPRRGLEGEDRRSAPRCARRAARTLGAARANGASASAVGAVRRSNDGGRRETHPRNAGRARRARRSFAGNAESAWLCAARGAGRCGGRPPWASPW